MVVAHPEFIPGTWKRFKKKDISGKIALYKEAIISRWNKIPDNPVLIRRNAYDVLASYVETDTVYNFDKFAPRYLKTKIKNPITVWYEDLVRQPETILRELCKRLGIDFYSEMLEPRGVNGDKEHYSGMQASKPIFTDSIGHWHVVRANGFKPTKKQLKLCERINANHRI